MSQKSIPWPRGVAADSVAGYTAQEWAGIWAEAHKAGGVVKIAPNLRTTSTLANIGVFYSVDNKLAVTNPGGAANRIDVDTGSALVCGHAFYNDASIGAAADITSPAASSRIDRVVVRCNFAAADYVPANASAALFTVPSYTARITVIHGAEGGGAPALTQDATLATYWDIPLYQYTISIAGVISSLTDEREWVDVETKTFFVQSQCGYNQTDGTYITMGSYSGVLLPDAKLSRAFGAFTTPQDFITSMTVSPVVVPSVGGGDIYASSSIYYGGDGEAVNLHTVSPAYAAITLAVAMNSHDFLTAQSLASAASGDIFHLEFSRDATDPLDTLGASLFFVGWIVEYIGWK